MKIVLEKGLVGERNVDPQVGYVYAANDSTNYRIVVSLLAYALSKRTKETKMCVRRHL